MARRLRAPTVLAAALLAAAGCGDTGPTKAEFIAKADAICADLDRRAEQIGGNRARTPDELIAQSRQIQQLISDGVGRLRALKLPENEQDRRGAQRYIDSVRAAERPARTLGEGSKRLEAAVRERSRAQARTALVEIQQGLREFDRVGDESDRVARSYGFKKCGQET